MKARIISTADVKCKAFDDICEIINDCFKNQDRVKFIDFDHGDMIVDCIKEAGIVLEAVNCLGVETEVYE